MVRSAYLTNLAIPKSFIQRVSLDSAVSDFIGCWFVLGFQKGKMFSISEGILKVALENVWSLKLHEQVIAEFLKKLKESIVSEKVVKDPVMVDEKTLVVLDGMHRVVALRELGYSYIPCCLIEYKFSTVQLAAWYRVITGDKSISEIAKLIRSSFPNLKLTELDADNTDRMVNEGKGICALRSSNSAWLISTGKKLNCRDKYDSIYSIEEMLRFENLRVSYQTEFDAKTFILDDKHATCLVVPTLTKDEVLRFALNGEVFAPKATRHVFPFRMLGVNIPVELLDGKRFGLDEANEKLQTLFSGRKLVKLAGGQIVDGRRYEEPIYLFES
jgi:hypothetical protein